MSRVDTFQQTEVLWRTQFTDDAIFQYYSDRAVKISLLPWDENHQLCIVEKSQKRNTTNHDSIRPPNDFSPRLAEPVAES